VIACIDDVVVLALRWWRRPAEPSQVPATLDGHRPS